MLTAIEANFLIGNYLKKKKETISKPNVSELYPNYAQKFNLFWLFWRRMHLNS